MSDIPPEVTDLAKVGGSGGFGALVGVLLARVFGSQDKALDKVLARLDVLQSSVSELSSKLAVLVATSERRDVEIESLKSQAMEHGKSIARLEAVISKLAEGA